MIEKEVNKKMIDALGIVDDKLPVSPRSLRRGNIPPPLNKQKSSPVPFANERPWEEPFGKDKTGKLLSSETSYYADHDCHYVFLRSFPSIALRITTAHNFMRD